ncbi:MAG: outer membrane protein assembly factor BamA [Chlorobi bacterium]|nr:outer membrane protein assembly factor BamA [Chlorobiota bacterium]
MTPTRSLIVSWLALLFVHQLAYTQTPDAKPQSLRIRDIRVEGNETASASAIIAYSNLRIGDVIGAGSEAFPKAIKNLMDRRLFSDVKIYVEDMRGDEGVIVISVKEYGRVGVVTFQGNDEFSEKDLESVVTIRTGDIASPYEIDRSRSKIRAKYGEEGYLFTKVKVETTPSDDDDGRSNLQFNIEEGPEVSIGAITIEGNAKIPDDALKGAMSEVKEKSWWQFWRTSGFDRKKLKKDETLIVDYYRERGFINASVLSDSISIDPTTGKADVQISVSEGRQMFLRNVALAGNNVYPSPVILHRLDVDTNAPYNQVRLEKNLNGNEDQTDVRSLYLDNGYLTFNAQLSEQPVNGDTVDVLIKMVEGNPASIRYVTISGNTRTKDKVIRRELFTHPGDVFSKASVIRSLRNLANLNYFNPERLEPAVQPVDATTVDITYKVEERPSDTFNASIGLSSQGLTGMLGVSFNNFSLTEPLQGGGGQILNFNWEFGSYVTTFSLGLTEPYLFDWPVTLGSSVFYQTQDLTTVSTNENKLRRAGISVTSGWKPGWPDDFFRADMVVRFLRNDITGSSTYYRDGTELSSTFSISRSSIDNPVFPKYGSRFSLSSTIAGLGNAEYVKPELKLEFYSPIVDVTESNSLVFYLGSEFGYLYNYGDFANIPPLSLYAMGGTALTALNAIPLRGYEDRSIGPVGGDGIPVGQVYNKISTELRFSIAINPIPIFVLAFAEAGNVWSNLSEVDPFNLKRSAGFGIRVMVPPVGILGFDYGYGFDPSSSIQRPGGLPERSGWQFHFQFGK